MIFFFLLLVRSPSTFGSVTVTSTGSKFTADAASFGKPFSYGLEYMARVQEFPHDPHLCANFQTNVDHTSPGNTQTLSEMLRGRSNSHIEQMFNNPQNEVFDERSKIIVPTDGTPVAILALRGQCTYEQKALAASRLVPEGVVHFVIVYDDQPDKHLIRMTKDGDTNDAITDKIGLTFISQDDGLQLKRAVNWQPDNERRMGGPHILLSSHSRFFLSFQTTFAKWAAILCLSFICAASCLCILGSDNTPPDNQVVVSDGSNPGRYRHGLRLLNEEEVKELPEVEFGSVELADNESSSGKETPDTKDKVSSKTKEEKKKKHKEKNPASAEGNTDPESLIKSDSSQCSKSGEIIEGAKVIATVIAPPTYCGDTIEYFHSCSCSICLEDYEPCETIRILPCQHAFHSDCIIPWLTDRSPTCPLCKAMFEVTREGDVDDGGNDDEGDDNASQQSIRTRTMLAFGMSLPSPPTIEQNPTEEINNNTPSSSILNRLPNFFRRNRNIPVITQTNSNNNSVTENENAQSDLQQPLLGRNEI